MKRVILALLLLSVTTLFALESDPSETVGFVKYECVNVAGGDFNIIAIPLDCPYSVASDMGADYPAITSIKYWDETNQQWVASNNLGGFWAPDNPIEPNEVYYVNVSSATDIYIAGGMNADPVYNFVSNANGDFNTAMLPLDCDFTMASEWGNDIGTGSECTSIKEWDNTNQQWIASNNLGGFWAPDNSISIAQGYYVNVNANVTWPSSKKSLKISKQKINSRK